MNSIKKYKWIIMSTSIILIAFLSIIMNLDKGRSGMVLAYGKVSQDAIEVSLINLIATPEQYDGKLVRVIEEWEMLNLKAMDYISQEMTIKKQ